MMQKPAEWTAWATKIARDDYLPVEILAQLCCGSKWHELAEQAGHAIKELDGNAEQHTRSKVVYAMKPGVSMWPSNVSPTKWLRQNQIAVGTEPKTTISYYAKPSKFFPWAAAKGWPIPDEWEAVSGASNGGYAHDTADDRPEHGNAVNHRVYALVLADVANAVLQDFPNHGLRSKAGKPKKIKVAGEMIEHWSNYRARFEELKENPPNAQTIAEALNFNTEQDRFI